MGHEDPRVWLERLVEALQWKFPVPAGRRREHRFEAVPAEFLAELVEPAVREVVT